MIKYEKKKWKVRHFQLCRFTKALWKKGNLMHTGKKRYYIIEKWHYSQKLLNKQYVFWIRKLMS